MAKGGDGKGTDKDKGKEKEGKTPPSTVVVALNTAAKVVVRAVAVLALVPAMTTEVAKTATKSQVEEVRTARYQRENSPGKAHPETGKQDPESSHRRVSSVDRAASGPSAQVGHTSRGRNGKWQRRGLACLGKLL